MRKSEDMQSARCRLKLLSSVSALSLLGSALGGGAAQAAQTDARPSVWLDLGWHFEGVSGNSVPFMPPFADHFAAVGAPSPDITQNVMGYGDGGDGGISFQPDGSDWVFSASIRYGRARGHRQIAAQTSPAALTFHTTGRFGIYPASNPKLLYLQKKWARASGNSSEKHLIVDFQAGRDVGMGLFGRGSTSVVSAGVRYAKLDAKSGVSLSALPDPEFKASRYSYNFHAIYPYHPAWHDYTGNSQNQMHFKGIGPAVSWKASVPIAGDAQDDELTFDWGVNAALLFGKQNTTGKHEATGRYYGPGHFDNGVFYGPSPVPHDRTRHVIVPNLGGFAGLSLKWSAAKISMGYRADFFFNALDTGIDSRHETTRGFYGPFASISIGVSPSDF